MCFPNARFRTRRADFESQMSLAFCRRPEHADNREQRAAACGSILLCVNSCLYAVRMLRARAVRCNPNWRLARAQPHPHARRRPFAGSVVPSRPDSVTLVRSRAPLGMSGTGRRNVACVGGVWPVRHEYRGTYLLIPCLLVLITCTQRLLTRRVVSHTRYVPKSCSGCSNRADLISEIRLFPYASSRTSSMFSSDEVPADMIGELDGFSGAVPAVRRASRSRCAARHVVASDGCAHILLRVQNPDDS